MMTIPGQPDQYQTLEDCLVMVGSLVNSLSPHLDKETLAVFHRLSLRLAYLCQTHPHCSEHRATFLLWLRTQLTKGVANPDLFRSRLQAPFL